MLNTLYDDREAESILRVLYEDTLDIDFYFLASDPNYFMSDLLSELLYQRFNRLMKNEPVQYVTGKSYFYGRAFFVDESVLIPRNETEEMVSKILSIEILSEQPLKILDIGTGSGCIPVTLSLERPNWQVSACDISRKALDIATRNSRDLSAKVTFLQDDILNPRAFSPENLFDVIISNPPYVTEEEKVLIKHNVLDYEPAAALFVPDDDPLKFYRAIGSFCKNHLKSSGRLYLEINERFGDGVASLFSDMFEKVEIISDLHNKQRFAFCSSYSLCR
ncbi:MAG: peptide chain release factor N(5)-glutamine methyltransferase [Bacteroidales bacterium]|nr:peptide chain release factor N(5)-glutamine methyltransferase [Bacteroidales bacterium]